MDATRRDDEKEAMVTIKKSRLLALEDVARAAGNVSRRNDASETLGLATMRDKLTRLEEITE